MSPQNKLTIIISASSLRFQLAIGIRINNIGRITQDRLEKLMTINAYSFNG